MSFDYINEAFRKLNSLTEDTFDTSLNGLNALADFQEQDDATDIVKIIDPEAETEEGISDSYVGKVIINCNVCHSHIFESKEDVVIDEDGIVNVDMTCPYCGEMSGFTIVGEIQPYGKASEDSAEDNETPEEETEATSDVSTEEVTESLSNGRAEGGFRDTYARPNASTSKLTHDNLKGQKTRKVLARDLKPGMMTDTGTVTKVTDVGWQNGRPTVEISYGGIGARGSYAADVVAANKEYEVLGESFTHELTEAFRDTPINDSYKMLKDFLVSKGLSVSSKQAIAYMWSVIDLFESGDIQVTQESLEKWFADTEQNYPEDLEIFSAATDLEEGIFDKFKKKTPTYAVVAPVEGSKDEWYTLVVGSDKDELEKFIVDAMNKEAVKRAKIVSYQKAAEITGDPKHAAKCYNLDESLDPDASTEGKIIDKEISESLKTKFVLEFDNMNGSDTGWLKIPTNLAETDDYDPDSWFTRNKNEATVFSSIEAAKDAYNDYVVGLSLIADDEESLSAWTFDDVIATIDGSSGKSFNESIEELSLTANGTHIEVDEDEDGRVTLVAEPVDAKPDEMQISPVSDETVAEIEANNAEAASEEEVSEEEPVEGEAEGTEEVDVDIDEVDEESLDQMGESYLKNTYRNVESFKTTAVSTTDSKMIVEGIVTFTSGVKKNTGFVFEAYSVDFQGKVKFIGSNKHLSESVDAFTLTGRVENKKLLPESLSYNYNVNNELVSGTINKK